MERVPWSRLQWHHRPQVELTILDRLYAIAAVLDRDGRILRCTRAFVDVCGYPHDELSGRHLWELAGEQDGERLRGAVTEASEVPQQITASLRTRTGGQRTIAWTCVTLSASTHDRIVFGVDITAATPAREDIVDRVLGPRSQLPSGEQALLACERELATIYASVPGVVFHISIEPDGEFRFVSVSETFLRVTGLHRDAVVGKSVREVIPQPACDMVLERYREAIRTGQTVRWEEESVYPAGSRVGEVAITPLYDASGIATRLIGIVHDLTERKRAEDAIRAADARKTEFLAALSHELRNPLTPIRNALAILEHDFEHDVAHSERSRRALSILDRQVAHLVHLVDDLLDITRITQSRINLRRDVLDLGSLVRGTIDDHRDGFETRGISLELVCPDEALHVLADPVRIVQVIGNVLGNAMKFTPREGSVTVTLERVGEAAMLRVRDDGIGLDAGLIDTLFVPFAQAHQPLDRTDGGLGLGLALVKHLVELHDGSVAVSSDGPGRGTELAIRIPLTDSRPRERVAPVLSEVRRRVLVIEDNLDAAETLRDMLACYGHEIRVAHDGPSGLAAVDAFDPEVVLCDLGLPGMSGYEVCRALRADTARRRILIALSGYAQPDDRAKTAAVGFDDHLAKPPTSEELHRAITMPRDNGA